ncbi:hypothetical protein VaNZ11_011921 [Volvox africanus]|uniref:DUS-like FMN-binding domain-containing protein n=1 Tax=Volvox africanus TaxID=51714 RepID=A0ABQ5SDK1_9CHLO|nr:hypothetical protein VaNZ11_011921 [Volvox africanus]
MPVQAQFYNKFCSHLRSSCVKGLLARQGAAQGAKLAPCSRNFSRHIRANCIHRKVFADMQFNSPEPSGAGRDCGAAAMAPELELDEASDSTSESPSPRRPLLSVAPMMDWTDIHFRQLVRLLSRRTWLWTEMVVDKTILHTQNLDKFLWFPPEQRPLVLQLGGSDPVTLAAATAKAAEYGYDEINLNCGCPSDRVAGAGCFGAALMLQPQLVAECMAAMAASVAAAEVPGSDAPPAVTVKCRLGVDEADSYAQLHEFVRVVSEGSPVRHFVIHARKAFLNGLSPHQNRTVPPLRHQWAWALARDFPHLQFSLNGGLLNCHEARSAILTAHPSVPYTRPVLPPSDPRAAAAAVCGLPDGVGVDTSGSGRGVADRTRNATTKGGEGPGQFCSDNGGGIEGVMIGRAAYNDPWGCLADADRAVYGELDNPAPSRRWVIERYRQYAESMVGRWAIKPDGHADPSIRTLMKPLLNLFHGEPGCKRWKNTVDELLRSGPSSFGEVLDRSLHHIPDHVLDAKPRQPDLAALPPFELDTQLPAHTSRAGQNQSLPGSKPRREGGAATALVSDAPVHQGCAAVPEPDTVAGNGCFLEQQQQQQNSEETDGTAERRLGIGEVGTPMGCMEQTEGELLDPETDVVVTNGSYEAGGAETEIVALARVRGDAGISAWTGPRTAGESGVIGILAEQS